MSDELREAVNCNLCGLEEKRLFMRVDSFPLVDCPRCGLRYVSPRLSQEALKDLYSRDYFQSTSSVTAGYDDYLKDRENLIKTARKKLKLIKRYKEGGSLLDIGCAVGFFLKVCQDEGFEVMGVELSPFAAHYAKESLGLRVLVGQLLDLSLPSESFDVITMWDVIEHLPDPLTELREIERLLRPEGILVIMTPNIASLVAKIAGKRWLLYMKPQEHLYYFSPTTLKAMLRKAGFEVVKVFTFGKGGKHCSLLFIFRRLKEYSRMLFTPFYRLSERTPLGRWSLYVDMGDNMVAVARKTGE